MWLAPAGNAGRVSHSPAVIKLAQANPSRICASKKAAQSALMAAGSLPGRGRTSSQLYQAQISEASSIRASPGTSRSACN